MVYIKMGDHLTLFNRNLKTKPECHLNERNISSKYVQRLLLSVPLLPGMKSINFNMYHTPIGVFLSYSVVRLIRPLAKLFGLVNNVSDVRHETVLGSQEQYLRRVILSNEQNGQKGCNKPYFP